MSSVGLSSLLPLKPSLPWPRVYLAVARKKLGALRRHAGLLRSPLRGTKHAAPDISEILAVLAAHSIDGGFVT